SWLLSSRCSRVRCTSAHERSSREMRQRGLTPLGQGTTAGCQSLPETHGKKVPMKAMLLVISFCLPALTQEVETDYSLRLSDDRGRETDAPERRHRSDGPQSLNVIHDGLSTQTRIPPGGSARVITGPGTPNGQPLIILRGE